MDFAQHDNPSPSKDSIAHQHGFMTQAIRILLKVWMHCHTMDGMKMTLHIDDALLTRVMAATGAESKTKAIDLALREVDRRATLVKLANAGLGLTADEMRDAIDPAYDLGTERMRETPVPYGRKSRPRG